MDTTVTTAKPDITNYRGGEKEKQKIEGKPYLPKIFPKLFDIMKQLKNLNKHRHLIYRLTFSEVGLVADIVKIVVLVALTTGYVLYFCYSCTKVKVNIDLKLK